MSSKKNKIKNPVAKFAHQFNKFKLQPSLKKKLKHKKPKHRNKDE
jgi:hypothetical protein